MRWTDGSCSAPLWLATVLCLYSERFMDLWAMFDERETEYRLNSVAGIFWVAAGFLMATGRQFDGREMVW